jgi:hypothetical protein
MGAAVFVIVDYRTKEPAILFWQGESKLSQYGKIDSERPLWFAITEGQLVFSSICDYFPALLRGWDIYSLAPNWLFTFDGKELKSVKNYPRTDVGQYNISYYPTKGSYYNSYNYYNNYDKIHCNYTDFKCSINNGVLAHKNYKVNEFGTINPVGTNYEIWFWEGIVLINEKCFHILENICESLGILPKELLEYYKEVVLYFSVFPYTKVGNVVYKVNSPMISEVYSGQLVLPFSNLVYTIDNGLYKSCTTSTYESNMKIMLSNMANEIKLDHEIFKFLNLDESI